MITKFIDLYMENKHKLEKALSDNHPESYEELVKLVIKCIFEEEDFEGLDYKKIKQFGGNEYSGDMLFLIEGKERYPEKYYYLFVNYGSCCACDTLKSIEYDFLVYNLNDKRLKSYMNLSLHIIQRIKELSSENDGDIEEEGTY